MMEKKRRARMNVCFDKLKELLLHSDLQQSSKLEKADVLEKTVVYTTQLQQENRRLQKQLHQIMNTDTGQAYQGGLREGFSACAATTADCLQRIPLPPPICSQEYRNYLRQNVGERLAAVFGRMTSDQTSNGGNASIFPTTSAVSSTALSTQLQRGLMVNGVSRRAQESGPAPSLAKLGPEKRPTQAFPNPLYFPFPTSATAAALVALQSRQLYCQNQLASGTLENFTSPPPPSIFAMQFPGGLAQTIPQRAPTAIISPEKEPRDRKLPDDEEKIDVESITAAVEDASNRETMKRKANDDSGISISRGSSSSNSPKAQSTSPVSTTKGDEGAHEHREGSPLPTKLPRLHRPYL